MKNLKKALSVVLTLSLIAITFACGNGAKTSANTETTAAPAAEVKKVELKLGFEKLYVRACRPRLTKMG